MLNEPSGAADNEIVILQAPPAPVDTVRAQLRAAVEEVFVIDSENSSLPAPITVSYTGHLLIDSVTAYDQLDAAFAKFDYLPVFTTEADKQVIRVMRGRFKPRPRPVWPNVLLFALTVLTLLYTGSLLALNGAAYTSPLDLLRGWPFALCVILILGCHEFGHYFAARHHKVSVTLPYFIPMPPQISPLGTMGAFIQLREPMRNRRVLFDVGAAGPLAGIIVAIPILLIGLKTSQVQPLPIIDLFTLKAHSVTYDLEGNSLLYMAAKFLVFGRFLPNGIYDVFINQVAQAGWIGLLVTALNLIPVGQLDGGHTLYSLIGERARMLYLPLLALLGVLSLFAQEWLLWLLLLLIFGRIYATPLDMITTLDRRRRILAVVTLVIFVLVFMPFPFQEFTIGLLH